MTDSQPPTDVNPLEWQRQEFSVFRNSLLSSLKLPVEEVKRWSWLSLVFAALSGCTVLAGCIFALIVAFRRPPGEWTNPAIIMSIVSNVVAVLTTAFNVFVHRQLDAARKELAERRDQIDRFTSKLSKRLFGESGEPSVVTYAHKDAIAGRLIKLDKEHWDEVSFQGEARRDFKFKRSRIQGNRIFLEDISKPRRNIELEIDLDLKRIRWMDHRTRVSEELYRVLDTD